MSPTPVRATPTRHVPAYRSVIDLGRIRTSLTVPLRKEGALLAAVRSHRQEVRRFSDKQIALVESRRPCGHRNGERAAVGRNARGPRTADRHCRSAMGVINSSPGDLTPVFDAILEKAHSLCRVANASLELYDGENFHSVAERGSPKAFAEMLRRAIQLPTIRRPDH